MTKTWLVIRYEFWRHITRPGFLWALLGFPILIVGVAAGAIWFVESKSDDPLGVVDPNNVLIDPNTYEPLDEDGAPFLYFTTPESARTALSKGAIQGFFVVPANLETNTVELIHQGDIAENAASQFRDYVRTSFLSRTNLTQQRLFAEGGLDIEFISLEPDAVGNSPINFILPYMFGFLIFMAFSTSIGYLLQAVVEEKENRTMEILITSLRPSQLMIGKIVALIGLSLIQITIWLIFTAVGLWWAKSQVANFPDIDVPPILWLVALLWFLPLYTTIAGITTAIGISVTEVSEGQQAVGLLNILSMFPLWFAFLLFSAPDSPLAVGMTLFPFSAFLTIMIRWSLTTIPLWQLIISWLLSAGTAVLAIFMVSRLLQVTLLRYGQRVTFKEMGKIVWQGGEG